jgi:hypothetical protein
MKEESDLISIYSGTQVSANLLKGWLEREGISAVIRKVSNAGTWGIVPDNIDLFVQPSDKQRAERIIDEFIRSNKAEKL